MAINRQKNRYFAERNRPRPLIYDAGKYQPEIEGLIELRELARRVFARADETKP
jgi:hypothetical protein